MEARLWKDGKTISYRYILQDGSAIPLGKDKDQAILKVAQMGANTAYGSFAAVWILYQNSAYWKRLTPKSQKNYVAYSKNLLKVFAKVHVSTIKPMHIARYLREERINAPIQANKEISLLSNILNIAIENGLIDRNPCKEVKKNPERPRDMVPDTEVLEIFLCWLSNQTPQRQIIALAAEYASLAGSRQIEFLDLTWGEVDFSQGVIRAQRAKQREDKKVIELIAITPRMSDLLNRLKKLNRDCEFLFPNSKNTKYTADGFRTMWQKSIVSAINEGIINKESRFAFHDLRAYYTTQYKKQKGSLPDIHANPATTAKIYERSKLSKRSAL